MKQSQNQKLAGKDFITCGIFSVLFFVAMFLSAFMNMFGYTAAFYSSVVGFFIGILLVILNAKVQKTGAVFIFSIVPVLYFFASGLIEGFIGAVALMIAAALAEFIIRNNQKSFNKMAISSILYSVVYTLVSTGGNFINTDQYCDNALAHGINELVVEQMRSIYSIKPLLLVVVILTVILTSLGTLVGKRIMKKHLKKAGIL